MVSFVTNVKTWALDQGATRALVDELIALHLADCIPEPADVVDGALTFTVWPLAHQVVRFGKAALALVDAGSGHEAHVLIRAAIEHTVTAHYLTELGEDGAAAWVDAQSVQADRTINLGMASMPLDENMRTKVMTQAEAVEEKSALDGFLDICRELDVLPLYSWWALESTFVHATSTTQNVFTPTLDGETVLCWEPLNAEQTARHIVSSFALPLMWNASTLDRLWKQPRNAEQLAEISTIVGQPGTLPSRIAKQGSYSKQKARSKGWQPNRAARAES
jgi:hypothetical protein